MTENNVKSGVTDEMVNLAIDAFEDVYHAQTLSSGWNVDNKRESMRAALEAALGPVVAEINTQNANALRVLRQAYVTLARAFNRLHESSRSLDGELCQDFGKVRGMIETLFREQGVKL
jgi:hypothetical protein